MLRPGAHAALCLAILLAAAPALSSDGVLEINQTCALSAAGCFPGDFPLGFPVEITRPGSYRLTGNLDMSLQNPNTAALQVDALNVSIDLGGFTISGPTVCGPGLPVTSCAPSGLAVAVVGGGQVSVRNGIVTGMGGDGISLTYAARVEGVRVISNGGDGVHAQNGAIVRDVEAGANGGDGIDLGIEALARSNLVYGNRFVGLRVDGGVAVDNVASRNGEQGANFGAETAFHGNQSVSNTLEAVAGGRATGGNVCSDHTCTRTGAKRFYLTQGSGSNGAQALSACANGFHMANLWELLDPSNFVYDTALGVVVGDSGSGPPSSATGGADDGWIRDGFPALTNSNCAAWTSASASHFGNAVRLDFIGASASPPSGATAASPWEPSSYTCDKVHPVWCVED